MFFARRVPLPPLDRAFAVLVPAALVLARQAAVVCLPFGQRLAANITVLCHRPLLLDQLAAQYLDLFWCLNTDRRSRALNAFKCHDDAVSDQNVFAFAHLQYELPCHCGFSS